MKKITVSRRDSEYECFPDIVRLSDGRMLCVYRESQGHVPRDYTRIVIRESLDQGSSWGSRKVLAETRGSATRVPSWNCPRISELRDGRVVVACDSLLWPEDASVGRRSEVCLWWSEDGGSWTGPMTTAVRGIVPGKMGEVDGELIIGTHDRSGEGGSTRELLWRSDDGKRWRGPVVVADHPKLSLCEGSYLWRGGVLACFLRENSGIGLPGFKVLSNDGGATWGHPIQTPLPGCHRPVAGFWGRDVLVTYRCYVGRGTKATMLMGSLLEASAVFERDPERQPGRIFQIDYDRSERPDTGYSGWCILDDGGIFVVNYVVDDAPMAQIRGYAISTSDIVLKEGQE
jgi:sialidase-1